MAAGGGVVRWLANATAQIVRRIGAASPEGPTSPPLKITSKEPTLFSSSKSAPSDTTRVKSADSWKTVRVFISSTFRDMHAERDHLVKVVFPELRESLQPYRIYLEDIDLRWGVTPEQAENARVIDLCLQTVDDCRPLFIGILGERYGFTADRFSAEARAHYPWLESRLGDSLTELEIIHGALQVPEGENRTFFYFRDPHSLDDVPEQMRADAYIETDPSRRARLGLLKDRIRASGRPVFDGYPATWNSHAYNQSTRTYGRFVGLEPFGTRVRDQLWEAIRSEFGLTILGQAETPTSTLDDENDHQERFLEARLRVFVGRISLTARLEAFAEGKEGPLCLLTGPAGSGKSALLAQFVSMTRRLRPESLVFAHFVGASPRSAERTSLLRRLCTALSVAYLHSQKLERLSALPLTAAHLKEPIEQEYTIPFDLPGLVSKCGAFLALLPQSASVVIIIDAVDQLEDANEARPLEWLPLSFPENVKVILSCASDRPEANGTLKAIERRSHVLISVGPLSDSERTQIIHDVPSLSAKSLDPQQIALLLSNTATSNPLFLRVAIEELRGFGSYEKLTERIADLPHDVTTLFFQVIERLEQDFGEGIVHSMLSALLVARRGLYEAELRLYVAHFLNADDAPSILRQLRPYLLIRGALVGFYHQSLKNAVRLRYLSSDDSEIAAHSGLADFFLHQSPYLGATDENVQPPVERPIESIVALGVKRPNHRRADELPWQMLRARRWVDSASVLTDLEFLEGKASAGLLRDLISDIGALLREPKAIEFRRSAYDKMATSRVVFDPVSTKLRVLEEALGRDLEFISRRPSMLFQSVWNSSWWYDAKETALHLSIRVRWDRVGPKVHEMLELWRQQKEEREPGFIWVRSLRPPRVLIGRSRMVLAEHSGYILVASLSADGRRLLTASRGGELKLWDADSGQELRSFSQKASVSAAAISPDGAWIVSAGIYPDVLTTWDALTGEKLKEWSPTGLKSTATTASKNPAAGPASNMVGVGCIAISPDGRWIASGSDVGKVSVWDAQNGEEVVCLVGQQGHVDCIAFSPDGVLLASAGGSLSPDGAEEAYVIRVWDWRSATQKFKADSHTSIVSGLAFSPTGSILASCSGDGGGGFDVKLWAVDLVTAPGFVVLRLMANLSGHSDCVRALAFSPDGQRLVTGSWDETVRVWDVGTRRLISQLNAGAKVNVVGFFPLGDRIFSGGYDQAITVWQDLENEGEAPVRLDFKDNTWATTFSNDGSLLASGSEEGHLWLWDVNSGTKIRQFQGQPGPVNLLKFSPDSRSLATATGVIRWARGEPWHDGERDFKLRVYDVATGAALSEMRGHTDKIECFDYVAAPGISGTDIKSGSEYRLVSGSRDGTVRVWNGKTYHELACLTGHSAEVRRIAASADGRMLVTAADDKTVRVWDLTSFRELLCYRGHNAEIESLAISPDAKRVLSAAEDGTTRIWNIETGEDLLQLDDPTPKREYNAWGAEWSPDGSRIFRLVGYNTICESDASNGAFLRSFDRCNPYVGVPLGNLQVAVRQETTVETAFVDAISGRELAWYPGAFYYPKQNPSSPIWVGSPFHVRPLENEARFIELLRVEGGQKEHV